MRRRVVNLTMLFCMSFILVNTHQVNAEVQLTWEEPLDFYIMSENAFPERQDLNLTVLIEFRLLLTFSDGEIYPNTTHLCEINIAPQYVNLTTSLDADLGMIKFTGATNTVSLSHSYLLGDSPSIPISYGSITVTVWIHGSFTSSLGIQNCSVNPMNLIWMSWGVKNVNISTSAEPFQTLPADVQLNYSAGFDVQVEGLISGYGETPSIGDQKAITNSIDVIPEFPSHIILPLFLLSTLLAVMTYKKKSKA